MFIDWKAQFCWHTELCIQQNAHQNPGCVFKKLTSQCNTYGYTGDMEETKLVVIKNDQAEQDWWDYGGKNISPLSTGLKY